MRLKDILKNYADARWESQFDHLPIDVLSVDSRIKQEGGLFFAIDGLKARGEDFIMQAIAQGARAIVKKGDGRLVAGARIPDAIALIETNNPAALLRHAAKNFYGNPSKLLNTIGITGTNGKTTVTYLLEAVIASCAGKAAVLGTVNYRIGQEIFESKNTTPGFLELQQFMVKAVEQKASHCVMEVSSHALVQGRVDGIDFKAAIFTNLTQDHLDYHKDMEQYFVAKSLLFSRLEPGAVAIINQDDPAAGRLMKLTKAKVITYGIDNDAQVMAKNIAYTINQTCFDLHVENRVYKVSSSLVGKHNVYNLLATLACIRPLGFDINQVLACIHAFNGVPGRLERVPETKSHHVFIDYAHTEDGLKNVLQALRQVSSYKLTVVFGCGGDRDRGKRPKMGQVACALADKVILTSDNPRSEDPQAIINDILEGCDARKVSVCLLRKEAICRVLNEAVDNEIILLAGKGHERYQILNNQTVDFDERLIVKECMGV